MSTHAHTAFQEQWKQATLCHWLRLPKINTDTNRYQITTDTNDRSWRCSFVPPDELSGTRDIKCSRSKVPFIQMNQQAVQCNMQLTSQYSCSILARVQMSVTTEIGFPACHEISANQSLPKQNKLEGCLRCKATLLRSPIWQQW